MKNLWIMHVKVSKTATYKKIGILAIFTSLLTYFLKSKTPMLSPILESIFDAFEGGKVKSSTFRSF